jgi:hypothetical protein
MNARTRRLRGHHTPGDATDWCLSIIAAGLVVLAVCFAVVQITGVAA